MRVGMTRHLNRMMTKLLQCAVSILFLCIFFGGCKNNSQQVQEGNSLLKLESLAIDSGDTEAYDGLSLNFMESPDNKFLYTALMMANKHKYPPAFIDVYYCLTDLTHKGDGTELDDLDDKTRSLALEYLDSGAQLGNKECMGLLGRQYLTGKYIPKDESRGNSLIEASEL